MRANRRLEDLEEEEEYLMNVESISHPTIEDSMYGKDGKEASSYAKVNEGSTKESSIISE